MVRISLRCIFFFWIGHTDVHFSEFVLGGKFLKILASKFEKLKFEKKILKADDFDVFFLFAISKFKVSNFIRRPSFAFFFLKKISSTGYTIFWYFRKIVNFTSSLMPSVFSCLLMVTTRKKISCSILHALMLWCAHQLRLIRMRLFVGLTQSLD